MINDTDFIDFKNYANALSLQIYIIHFAIHISEAVWDLQRKVLYQNRMRNKCSSKICPILSFYDFSKAITNILIMTEV